MLFSSYKFGMWQTECEAYRRTLLLVVIDIPAGIHKWVGRVVGTEYPIVCLRSYWNKNVIVNKLKDEGVIVTKPKTEWLQMCCIVVIVLHYSSIIAHLSTSILIWMTIIIIKDAIGTTAILELIGGSGHDNVEYALAN